MNSCVAKVFFASKRVEKLYHANTVVTALTFINNGGLLSRGAVDDRKLPQTSQYTDAIDKRFGIFYDIFFDSVDIHTRGKNINKYGPVTFVYGIDVLDEIGECEVKVTKQNPSNWDDKFEEKDKYFVNMTELEERFVIGDFGQEITICSINGAIGFSKLKEVILDDPGEEYASYFEDAKKEIINALRKNGVSVELKIRKCLNCKCKSTYKEMKEWDLKKRFKITL